MGDAGFDALYPEPIRAASARFWTPLTVASRAARLLARHGARRVLDLGSGAGKFCLVAACLRPEMELVGVEQRPHLVEAATVAASRLGLSNVRFHAGDATTFSWSEIEGLYLYNPFGENKCREDERLDHTVELSAPRFLADVGRVVGALAAAPPGLTMVTYHGFGGPIPASWELVAAEPTHTDWLRVWEKQRPGGDLLSFYVEDGDAVALVDAVSGRTEKIPPPFHRRPRRR